MLEETQNKLDIMRLKNRQLARSYVFNQPNCEENNHKNSVKTKKLAIKSMLKMDEKETSKSRLSQALTSCPIKTKEEEEIEYRQLISMKDQVFKAKYLMDPFFKRKVMSKIRRYEKQKASLKKLAQSYGQQLETEQSMPTLVQIKLVQKSSLELLYRKYLNIFGQAH